MGRKRPNSLVWRRRARSRRRGPLRDRTSPGLTGPARRDLPPRLQRQGGPVSGPRPGGGPPYRERGGVLPPRKERPAGAPPQGEGVTPPPPHLTAEGRNSPTPLLGGRSGPPGPHERADVTGGRGLWRATSCSLAPRPGASPRRGGAPRGLAPGPLSLAAAVGGRVLGRHHQIFFSGGRGAATPPLGRRPGGGVWLQPQQVLWLQGEAALLPQ